MRFRLHLKQEGAQIQANTARLAAIIALAGAIGGAEGAIPVNRWKREPVWIHYGAINLAHVREPFGHMAPQRATNGSLTWARLIFYVCWSVFHVSW